MKFLKGILLVSCLVSISHSQAQNWNPNVSIAISSQKINPIVLLQQFENLGIKEPGSTSLQKTAEWIDSIYNDLSYSNIVRDSFLASGHWQQNIFAKKEGASDDFVIIGSHYDTKNGPGVNDNGTGVVATMLAAATLVDLNINRTIYFVHFSGEEEGYFGSKHFVDSVLPKLPGELILMLNLDQLGGTIGQPGNDKIYCERDEISSPLDNNLPSARYTDTIANLCKLYTDLEPIISAAYASDYLPFEGEGHVISGIFQFSKFPQRHSLEDSLKLIDTLAFKQVLKLTSAIALHFAQVPKFISVSPTQKMQSQPYVYEGLLYMEDSQDQLEVSVFDLSGRKLTSLNCNECEFPLNIGPLDPGVYVLSIQSRESLLYTGKFLNR